jgi:hypothetical protein
MLNVERANVEFTRRLGWNFDLLHVIKLQSLTRGSRNSAGPRKRARYKNARRQYRELIRGITRINRCDSL